MFPIVGLQHMKAVGLATHSTNMKDTQFGANSESLACGNPPAWKEFILTFPRGTRSSKSRVLSKCSDNEATF